MNKNHDKGNRLQKIPLKVNVLELVRTASSQLTPLFPYLDPGSIVPCCAGFEVNGDGFDIGYFIHENVVDEVAIMVASNGGRGRTGDVFVGPRQHGVGGVQQEAYFAVMTITQRQREEGSHKEAMILQCEKCNTVTYRYEFDESVSGDGAFPGLPTIIGSDIWANDVNMDADHRTCKSCGHVNKPFPSYIWGWSNYSRNSRIVEKAWKVMEGGAA